VTALDCDFDGREKEAVSCGNTVYNRQGDMFNFCVCAEHLDCLHPDFEAEKYTEEQTRKKEELLS